MYVNNNASLPLRMVTYSQDGLGLGHMRRTHSIVSTFLQAHPDASVLTLSDSQLGQFFAPTPNHDYLKLPSVVKDGPGQWRAANLGVPFSVASSLRQEIIYHTLLNFQPHLLLVDHMPHGAMGELLPALAALREQGVGTKIVLGLRDILDAPDVVQSRWQVEGAYDAVEEFYDCVLVYGSRSVYDLAAEYGFSPCMAEKLRYCGYVCAPEESTEQMAPSATALRARYLQGGDADTKLVVAMAGGGADAFPTMSTLLDAVSLVQGRQQAHYVVVTGPFMPQEQRQELRARARHLPVHILDSVDDTYRYLEAADLIVAMAGYNTTVEILKTGKRAILVPRRGPSAEQRTRTGLFAQRGWIDMVDPDDLNATSLASLVADNLRRGSTRSAKVQPDVRGRHAAVEELLSLVAAPQPTTHYAGPVAAYAEERMYDLA